MKIHNYLCKALEVWSSIVKIKLFMHVYHNVLTKGLLINFVKIWTINNVLLLPVNIAIKRK